MVSSGIRACLICRIASTVKLDHVFVMEVYPFPRLTLLTTNSKYPSRNAGSFERARMKSWRGGGGRVAAARRSAYWDRKENLSERETIWTKRMNKFSV